MPAFQDAYPDKVSHCYGCGRLNHEGLQIKTRWEGEESVTHYRPRPEHMAIPGIVYGGLIAFLVAEACRRSRPSHFATSSAERAPKARFCSTVRCGKSADDWNT